MTLTPVRYGIHRGLNLDDLETTTQEEKDTYYNYARNNHVPLYLQTSHTVWLENRPDMMKLHHRLLPEFRRHFPEAVFMMSVGQLHTYIYLDWEIGITNEFKVMQDQGITKAQLMEIVMAAQIYAGASRSGSRVSRDMAVHQGLPGPEVSKSHPSRPIGTTTFRTSSPAWICPREISRPTIGRSSKTGTCATAAKCPSGSPSWPSTGPSS